MPNVSTDADADRVCFTVESCALGDARWAEAVAPGMASASRNAEGSRYTVIPRCLSSDGRADGPERSRSGDVDGRGGAADWKLSAPAANRRRARNRGLSGRSRQSRAIDALPATRSMDTLRPRRCVPAGEAGERGRGSRAASPRCPRRAAPMVLRAGAWRVSSAVRSTTGTRKHRNYALRSTPRSPPHHA